MPSNLTTSARELRARAVSFAPQDVPVPSRTLPKRGVKRGIIESPLTAAPSPAAAPQMVALHVPVEKIAGARRPQKPVKVKAKASHQSKRGLATTAFEVPTDNLTEPQRLHDQQSQSDYEAEFPGFAQPETFIPRIPEDGETPARPGTLTEYNEGLENNEDDDMDLDGEEEEELSKSYIDPESKTRLVRPPTQYGSKQPNRGIAPGPVEYESGDDTGIIIQGLIGSPARRFNTQDHEMADGNIPTSPIAASIERMIAQKKTVTKKRKFVEMTDTEGDNDDDDEDDSRIDVNEEVDILEQRKKKAGTKLPKHGPLAKISSKMRGQPRTPHRNRAGPLRRSPRRPVPRTPGRFNIPNRDNGSALRRSPRFTPRSQSPGTPVVRAAIKRRNRAGREGGPKPFQLAWYTPNMRQVLQAGKDYYRLQVLTVNAYPADETRAVMGRAAFDHGRARQENAFNLSSNQDYSSQKLRVLADTAWGTRGQVKTLARNAVVDGYKLKPPRELYASRRFSKKVRQERTREWTQRRVAGLLTRNKFIEGTQEEASKEGVKYANSNIAKLIRSAIGGSAYDIRHGQDVFRPMPIPLVALAALCLEAALEEWRTGTFVAHALSPLHEKRYRFHLRHLHRLEHRLPNRCRNLMNFIAEDAFFDDMQVGPGQEDEEEDDFEMYGADSEDDADDA